MSFDGITEEENIIERLSVLADGRILDMQPDDALIPKDSLGKVRPYIVLSVGAPFAAGSKERSMGDGEEDIPYVMTMVVGCYAGDRKSLNALYKATVKLLVGWSPNEDNALPLGIAFAYNGKQVSSQTRPTTFSKIAAIRTTINLSTGE